MTTQTFERLHPRGPGGQFATKDVNELDGGLQALAHLSSARGTTWPGVSDADRELFAHGSCEVLAGELRRRTGWPIVLVCDGPQGVAGWVHAGVMSPGGQVVDVEGIHDPDTWLDRWGEEIDAVGHDLDGYDGEAVTVLPADGLGWDIPWANQPDPDHVDIAEQVAARIVAAAAFTHLTDHQGAGA